MKLTQKKLVDIVSQLNRWKNYEYISTSCIRDTFKLTHSQAYRIRRTLIWGELWRTWKIK